MNSDLLPFGREFLPLHQHDAGQAGIAMIHQELQQVPHLTVAQKICGLNPVLGGNPCNSR